MEGLPLISAAPPFGPGSLGSRQRARVRLAGAFIRQAGVGGEGQQGDLSEAKSELLEKELPDSAIGSRRGRAGSVSFFLHSASSLPPPFASHPPHLFYFIILFLHFIELVRREHPARSNEYV